jgi:hypothetical protein
MPASAATRRVILAIALGVAALLVSARGAYEPDLWWHLAQGRENAHGRLVRTNTFGVLDADYPQPYTSWLFDTLAFAAWSAGGGAGVQLLQALVVALALGLTFKACRLRGPVVASTAVLLLGFFVLEPRAMPRPHLASFAGLAAFTWMLERSRAAGSLHPLRWAVPAAALWSNVHVEVVFGVAVVALAALAEWIRPRSWSRADARRGMLVALACGVATLATPYGWGIVSYVLQNRDVPAMLTIAELQPPYLPNYRAFWVYVSAAAALLLLPPRRIDLKDVLTLVVFAALGARYLRLTPLVFLATAPAVTARIADLLQRGLDRRALAISAAALALAVSRVPVPVLLTGVQFGDEALRPQAFFSDRAIAFARQEGLRGPMFNSINLGGDMAWQFYPEARVFQDSRLQAHPPGFFLALLRASRAQADWELLMAGVDWAVLSLARPGELSGIGRFPRVDWATVFWDEAVQVVVRREGPFASVAARHEYTVLLPGVDPFAIVARGTTGPVRDEARRNRRENTRGYLAPSVLCLSGDAEACGDLDRLADAAPGLREAIDRVRRVRVR